MANADDADDTTATLLPLTKIKKIMRSDPDVRTVSQEAVVLVTKATVLLARVFVQRLCATHNLAVWGLAACRRCLSSYWHNSRWNKHTMQSGKRFSTTTLVWGKCFVFVCFF